MFAASYNRSDASREFKFVYYNFKTKRFYSRKVKVQRGWEDQALAHEEINLGCKKGDDAVPLGLLASIANTRPDWYVTSRQGSWGQLAEAGITVPSLEDLW